MKEGKTLNSIALGNFDGVHIAHMQVLKAAAERPCSLCLLFKKHPYEVLTGKNPERIYPPEICEKKIYACGIEKIEYLDFEEIMDYSPERFFRGILVGRFNAGVISCGYNYTFGAEKSGNTTTLKSLCAEKGIKLIVSPKVEYKNEAVSSSRIRRAIKEGKIEDANKMLGTAYLYSGTVEKGKQLGRTLGFPTINQYFGEEVIKPLSGVYESEVILKGKKYKGLTNIGDNPTLGKDSFRSETYVFGFGEEVYGETASVFLKRFVREEKKFSSVDELKKQVLNDIERVKNV